MAGRIVALLPALLLALAACQKKSETAAATGDAVHLLFDTGHLVFAGAGIVAGSTPEKEFAETELKFRAMLGALGDVDQLGQRPVPFGAVAEEEVADGVADVLRGFGEILRVHELRHDLCKAVARFVVDRLDARNALDRFLDRLEHFALDLLGGRTGIDDRGQHDRRLHFRKLVRLQLCEGDQAESHQREHSHDGDERPLDREIRNEHGCVVG